MILSLKIIFLSGIQFDKKIIFFLVLPVLLAVHIQEHLWDLQYIGASAGILCVPALFGGVYGGGCFGSQVGKGKNFQFSVVGQNSNGRTVAQSFRLVNRKTSKKLKKELSQISGLKMGQVKIIKN